MIIPTIVFYMPVANAVTTNTTGLPMYCDYCSRPIQPYDTYTITNTMKLHYSCWLIQLLTQPPRDP